MMDLARSLDVLEVFLFDVIPTGRLSAQTRCACSAMKTPGTSSSSAPNTPPSPTTADHPPDHVFGIAIPAWAKAARPEWCKSILRANGDVCRAISRLTRSGKYPEAAAEGNWGSMTAHALYAEPSARAALSQPASGQAGGTRSRVLNRSGGEPEVGQTIDSVSAVAFAPKHRSLTRRSRNQTWDRNRYHSSEVIRPPNRARQQICWRRLFAASHAPR